MRLGIGVSNGLSIVNLYIFCIPPQGPPTPP